MEEENRQKSPSDVNDGEVGNADRRPVGELEYLNGAFKKIVEFRDTLQTIIDETKEKFDFAGREAWFYNPFDQHYDIEDIIGKIRTHLIGFVIDRTEDHRNFTIKTEEVKKHLDEKLGEFGFDAKVIADHIDSEYLSKADELSLKEINEKVSTLIPRFWKNGDARRPTVGELVKNDRLILRAYLDWRWGKPYLHDFLAGAAALEKLVNIVIKKAKPSEAISHLINNAYQFDVLGKHEIYDDAIKSVRIYKNGKFEMQLAKREYAEEMAKELIKIR